MDIKKVFTAAAVAAAPVLATAIGGPGIGALVASAVGAGAVTKKAGKAIEGRTGIAVHKIASPLAAVAAPASVAHAMPPDWINPVCDTLARLCAEPGVLIGAGAILWHVFVKNSRDIVS